VAVSQGRRNTFYFVINLQLVGFLGWSPQSLESVSERDFQNESRGRLLDLILPQREGRGGGGGVEVKVGE